MSYGAIEKAAKGGWKANEGTHQDEGTYTYDS